MKTGCHWVCSGGKHFRSKGTRGNGNRKGWWVQLALDLPTVRFLILDQVFTFVLTEWKTMREPYWCRGKSYKVVKHSFPDFWVRQRKWLNSTLPKLAARNRVTPVTALQGRLGEQSTFLALRAGYATSREETRNWVVCHSTSPVRATLSLVSGYLMLIQKPSASDLLLRCDSRFYLKSCRCLLPGKGRSNPLGHGNLLPRSGCISLPYMELYWTD